MGAHLWLVQNKTQCRKNISSDIKAEQCVRGGQCHQGSIEAWACAEGGRAKSCPCWGWAFQGDSWQGHLRSNSGNLWALRREGGDD